MSEGSDDALLELVAQEQRDFRRLLFGGLFALVLVALASVGTSVYLWRASTQIAAKIETFEFTTHRDSQDQVDRINRLQTEVRGLLREFWSAQRADKAGAQIAPDKAIAAAREALAVGRLSFEREILLDVAAAAAAQAEPAPDATAPNAATSPSKTPTKAAAPTLSPAQAALVSGVSTMLTWLRTEEAFPRDATFTSDLPAALKAAQDQFNKAKSDPALAADADAGLAWITFLRVQGPGSFTPESCGELLKQTDKLKAEAKSAAPQTLFWSAQCLRKSGRYFDSLLDYVALVNALAALDAEQDGVRALEINAFHGLGTQLIATHARPDADVAPALAIARARCPNKEAADTRMGLAKACLEEAVALRVRQSQTQSDLAGTLENMNFAYLVDGDFAGALKNADTVTKLRQAPLAWNELARFLAADNLRGAGSKDLPKDLSPSKALAAARDNIRQFKYTDFNVCELRALLKADLYEKATAELAAAFPKQEPPQCPKIAPAAG